MKELLNTLAAGDVGLADYKVTSLETTSRDVSRPSYRWSH
jgi:hypothetical protein